MMHEDRMQILSSISNISKQAIGILEEVTALERRIQEKKADREIIIEPKQVDLTDKCGSCIWATPIKATRRSVFGSYIECQNPNKVWKHDISRRKQRTTKKCLLWETMEERENET